MVEKNLNENKFLFIYHFEKALEFLKNYKLLYPENKYKIMREIIS